MPAFWLVDRPLEESPSKFGPSPGGLIDALGCAFEVVELNDWVSIGFVDGVTDVAEVAWVCQLELSSVVDVPYLSYRARISTGGQCNGANYDCSTGHRDCEYLGGRVSDEFNTDDPKSCCARNNCAISCRGSSCDIVDCRRLRCREY